MYMIYPDTGILKGLHKLAIRTEIADIDKRHHSVSLWVISFTKTNNRQPTDEECSSAITQLNKELEDLCQEQ